MIFIDKYAPTFSNQKKMSNYGDNPDKKTEKYATYNLASPVFHKKELQMLNQMSKDDGMPHLIFCGPEGSGKKTLIGYLLELLYGKNVHKITESNYKVLGSSNSATDVSVKQSDYHIVIEPNNNNFDRYLIQDVVKKYIKKYSRKVPLNFSKTEKEFKTILINNVDNLSYYAQTSLRRTMEKFSGTCRFIMWCKSLSRVIEPIRSRCYCFRISSPSSSELFDLMALVSYKESIKLTLQDYTYILDACNGNTKKLLWLLQLRKLGESYLTSYDKIIKVIIDKLLTCDVGMILKIRVPLYNTTTTNIPGSQIIRDITEELLCCSYVNDECKMDIAEIAARSEHALIKGRREIMHLELFIAGVMFALRKQSETSHNVTDVAPVI